MSQKRSTRRKCRRARQRAHHVSEILKGRRPKKRSQGIKDGDQRELELVLRKLLRGDDDRLVADLAPHVAALSLANELKHYSSDAKSFEENVGRKARDCCRTVEKILDCLQELGHGADESRYGIGKPELDSARCNQLEAWAKEIVFNSRTNKAC